MGKRRSGCHLQGVRFMYNLSELSQLTVSLSEHSLCKYNVPVTSQSLLPSYLSACSASLAWYTKSSRSPMVDSARRACFVRDWE